MGSKSCVVWTDSLQCWEGNWELQTWIKNILNTQQSLVVRSIKWRCTRNWGPSQMLWSSNHYQPWIQSPTVFWVESPARQQLARQKPALLCGKAQLPGLKQWHWADTAFRNQKSWIPNFFKKNLKTSSSLPVQRSHHESGSPSLLSPTLFFLHINTASTGVEEKTCSNENSTANRWGVQLLPWLLQSMHHSSPVKGYDTEIPVTARQQHCSSFLCAYHRFTLCTMR